MKKLIVLTSVFIILVIMPLLYFYSIWSKENEILDSMERKALKDISFIKFIDESHYFSGDTEYYLFLGRDHLGNNLIVWTNQNERTKYSYLEKKVNQEDIYKKANNKEEGLKVKRISPGIIDNNHFVYEVLFKDQKGRLGYLYYDLIDGEFIKMYRLGKKA